MRNVISGNPGASPGGAPGAPIQTILRPDLTQIQNNLEPFGTVRVALEWGPSTMLEAFRTFSESGLGQIWIHFGPWSCHF